MNSTPLISYENSLREIVAVEGGVKWFVAIINYYLYESVKTYNIAFFFKRSLLKSYPYFILVHGDVGGTESHDYKMATLDIKLKKANKVYREGVC